MAFLNGNANIEHASWNDYVVEKPIHNEQDRQQCRQCQSPSLVVDWAAGDRVCTNCGVVDEEHLRDETPEWRDFNDDNDLAKGLPSSARCGLVPVDETRYLGGLQPTTLSSTVYGGGAGFTARRKRLERTNRQMDFMMQKQHAKALKDAKLARKVRQRKFQRGEEVGPDFTRPEYEKILLQEEDDAQRSRDSLYAEKWSIERAILLHGHGQDVSTTYTTHHHHGGQEEREDLLKRLDASLLKASEDLYRAYILLQEASRKLELPAAVLHESTAMMCNYATRRDGIIVKGVSSRMSKAAKSSAVDQKEAAEKLRSYNKLKQSAALGSALLFLTARKLGWARSLSEVCSSFQAEEGIVKGKEAFLKPKHCSRAMSEVRALFPHYGQTPDSGPPTSRNPTSIDTADSIAGFVEHSTRKLELPPVALASIRTLVQHCRKEPLETEASTAKLSTICASMSLFVCLAGASLQRLARQAQNSGNNDAKRKHGTESAGSSKQAKRIKLESSDWDAKQSSEEAKLMQNLFDDDTTSHEVTPEHKDISTTKSPPPSGGFDIFSHSAVEYQEAEKRRYEMRRIWDAWSEQMPWHRNIGRIEQSCGVSRNKVLTFYKKSIYPRRQSLLKLLQDSSSSSSSNAAPLSSVLLKNIASAAPLLNSNGTL